jgi:uncharacterized protein (TIGR02302 family)
MSEPPPADPLSANASGLLPKRLSRRRAQARAVLLFERVWPALWPPLGLIGAFLCLALLDLPPLLPPLLHALLLLALAGGVVVTLLRGLRRLRLPDAAEADRRLERASGLRHRPLAALADRPALPGAEALWRLHVARAVAQAGRLRIGLPRPGLAAIDRRALRGGLVVALAACLAIAGPDAPDRIARAFTFGFAPVPGAAATELQAWITPPGYTDLAPIFLHPEGGALSVPQGSHLTVSVSGGHGRPMLTLAGRALPFQALDASSFQAEHDLTGGGRLVVRRGGAELAGWDLTVVADRAPIVTWPEPPGTARGSRLVPRTRLPWQVSHEYGVVTLQAELRLKDRPDAPPLLVPIPLPGGAPKQAKGARVQDLTPHPWAGLPVVARLVARDAPGATGISPDAAFTLPERPFRNPAARAIIAVRKALTLHPEGRAPAVAELDRIGGLDGVWQNDPGGYLNLRTARERLALDRAGAAVPEVQAQLWQLALRLEEGLTDRTARALEQARQALRDAMQAEKRGEKLPPGEIEKRIEALQQAIQQHLQALAEQLRRDPDAAQPADPESRQMNAEDAQKLAEQMKQAIEQGRMQDAQQQMAQLEKMLDALEHARPMQRDAQAKQRAQQRQKGRQQMSAVQDMVQREGGLLDHAQSRESAQPQPPPGFEPHADETPPQTAAPDSQAPDSQTLAQQHDARVQRALRRALGELMQQYGDLMGKIPSELGEADQAMRGAAENFADGADGEAAADVRRAIAALQKGGQSMSQQMAQAFGQSGQQEGDSQDGQDGTGLALGDGQGGDPNSPGGGDRPWQSDGRFGRPGDRRLDPFGRPLKEGTNGTDENADVTLPEQMEQARTRAIQEELRRRAGERSRPQQELDYIDRLLKQF